MLFPHEPLVPRSSSSRRSKAPAPAKATSRRDKVRPHRPIWRFVRLILLILIWSGLALGGVVLWFARDLPRPEAALDAARRPSLTLQDMQGKTFATYGDVVGDSLRLEDMPPYLPLAAVAVEDRRFWVHHGIDSQGLLRAVWVNLTAHRLVQGGSTITQQVAKNLFLSSERTLKRKVQEMMLTIWLERHFTKQEILEIWLNRVYLGSGTWGVDAAARLYFGVSARQVELWQAAVLAGLPRAPSRINPRVDPQAATARGREVLTAMAATGAISHDEASQAMARIHFPPVDDHADHWFADWVSSVDANLIPPNTDAVLRTTLNAKWQAVVETRLAGLLDGPGKAAGVGQGAVVVVDAASGAVRAMVGGKDGHAGAFNRATLARRQPGSSFKPFIWLAALEHGLTPDDQIDAGPVRIGHWSPKNFESHYKGDVGDVSLEEAFAQSLNTVSVRLLQQSGGPRAVMALAHRLGIEDDLPNNASLALGTGEVGLLELSCAYATILNGGYLVHPVAVESIQTDGRATTPFAPAPERVLDAQVDADMQRMMRAVVVSGTGRAAGLSTADVAGKTGTTQDSRDAWFIGGVNGVVIGVWLGNDDNHPMRGVTGGSLPARLFHEIAAAIVS